jgi:hypothetical protein
MMQNVKEHDCSDELRPPQWIIIRTSVRGFESLPSASKSLNFWNLRSGFKPSEILRGRDGIAMSRGSVLENSDNLVLADDF